MITESVIVFVGGKRFPFEAVVELMDDEIREKLHGENFGKVSEQEFTYLYCACHLKKFGENFTIN